MTTFRLLGVKIVKQDVSTMASQLSVERYKSVLKVFEDKLEDTFCFFYEIAINDNGENNFEVIGEKELPSNFFKTPSSNNDTQIEVSAIVGKNGSGKSSVIDLVTRLINNLACFAFTERPLRPAAERLHFIPDIYACLYYRKDDNYYKLEQKNNTVTLYSQESRLYQGIHTENRIIRDSDPKAENILKEHLFYTMIFNYSMHSYNFYDYYMEWDDWNNMNNDDIEIIEKEESEHENDDERYARRCWLTGLFHKNDGYQVPIVINPYREFGTIEMQNEKELSRERLIYLTLIRDENKNNYFKEVIDDKEAHCITFSTTNDFTDKHPFLKWMFNKKDKDELKSIYQEIITSWSGYLGIDMTEIKKESVFYSKCVNYLIYKTLKTSRNYRDYYGYFESYTKNNTAGDVQGMVKEFFEDKSHKTLKIRQTIAQIIFKHLQENEKEVLLSTISDKLEELENDKVGQFAKYTEFRAKYNHDGGLDEDYFQKYSFDFEELLPCPLFEPLLYLKSSSGTIINIDILSSGERQLINTFSSIIYHLRNIDSAFEKQGEHVKYNDIVVFVDEVELYFHPEFQVKFINFLLKWTSSINLNHIKNIHLCFSTHSPFILSDIPKQNIMFLTSHDESIDKDTISETFGANIYDILKGSFFLKKPIGDFSYHRIESTIKRINRIDATTQEEEVKSILSELELIGDDFLRCQLKQQLHQKKEYEILKLKSEKAEIERKIAELEEKKEA